MSTLPEHPSGARWKAKLRDGRGSEEAVLGTTDDSVVFRTETGRGGTVPRDHVSAVESHFRTETTYEGNDYRLLVGGGAVLSTLGFLGAVTTTSALLAFLLVLVGVGGLRVADYGWKNREQYEGIERVDREVEQVTIHVDGGVHREFVVPAEYGVGSRLATFVRGGDADGRMQPRERSSGSVVVRARTERAANERAANERAANERAANERAANERTINERTINESAASERAANESATTQANESAHPSKTRNGAVGDRGRRESRDADHESDI